MGDFECDTCDADREDLCDCDRVYLGILRRLIEGKNQGQ